VLPLVLIAVEWHFMEGDEELGSVYGRKENHKQYIGKM
jgi:hypothetical protein